MMKQSAFLQRLFLLFALFTPLYSLAQNAAADTIRIQLAALKPGDSNYLDKKIGMLGTLFISIVNTDPAEAMKVSDELAESNRLKGDSAGYYQAHYRFKARAYEKMGDYTNNIIYLEAYAAAMNRIGKSDSYTYVDLGNAYYASGLQGLAKGCYRQAEALFIRENNIQGLCTVHNNYAQIFMAQLAYDSALYELRYVHRLRMEKLKDPALAGDSKLLIGAVLVNLQQYDSAKIYFHQVLALLGSAELDAHTDHVALQEEYAGAYSRMASVFITEKNWDSAAFYLQKGLLYCQQAGYSNRVTNIYAAFARFYIGREMMDSALVNVRRFERGITGTAYTDGKLRLYKLYADYYKATGDSEAYYKNSMLYYRLADSLKGLTVNEGSLLASGTIMQLKNKSLIEEQNVQLIKKDIEAIEQRRQNTLLFALSGLFLFIISAGIFTGLQIRKKNRLIQRYNSELEEANATKEKFLSVISHDLRTPFNTIIGMSNVLLNNVKANKTGALTANAEAIHESSRKAYVLLDNLMQWVSLQKEKIHVNKELVPVNETVENVLVLFRNHALAQSVTIQKDIRTQTIFTDRNLIQVVLRNLLSNAVRHIPAGGTVKVSIEEKDENALLIVQDNGNGIDAETLKTLFAKKDQLSIARKGGGLGLLLVQEFVEQLGGTIQAENIPSGGAKFTIVLSGAAAGNGVHSTAQEEIEKGVRFSADEKKKMQALVNELKAYEIFDTTELRECLSGFNVSGSAALAEWVKNISNAIYHADNEQFKKLIALATL